MKISDLIKSLEKIKAKHGDLPIAYDKIIGYYYTTQAAHVTKICNDNEIFDDDVINLDYGKKCLNINDMLL